MLYILLPTLHISILKHVDCQTGEKNPEPFISQSLAHYLYEIKRKITGYGREWDTYKKYTNPYEYINSMVPNRSKCVSKYKPLSRSYFKMVEIMASFDFCDFKKINSFHIAEGPGGFIEALANARRNPEDTYTGMTLLDDAEDTNIPAWKKTEYFLRTNTNVHIENGASGTGDILVIENFDHCVAKYGSSMEIITADGGFDFSVDFNNQENRISKLLYAQACYAICLQKKGGNFILKIFDCFMEHTIDILYILSAFYKSVYITKPNTSRYANSEKYVVCKNFLFTNVNAFLPGLRACLLNTINCPTNIHRFLKCPISSCFINRIEEYNAISGQQQLEHIQQTITLMENKHNGDKIDNLIRTNVQKCSNWCISHDVPYNTFTTAPNNFLDFA
jgi:23S rRNA U2552 (ribose-2'-O)-methylase RlmE/FtsJ